MTGILKSLPGGFNPDSLDAGLRAQSSPVGVCLHCYFFISFAETKQAKAHPPKANTLLNNY